MSNTDNCPHCKRQEWAAQQPATTCERCGSVSYAATDVDEQDCGHCRDFMHGSTTALGPQKALHWGVVEDVILRTEAL